MTTTDEPRVKTRHSFCRVCHAACPIEVDIEDNKVTAVRGVMSDPLFEGYTCIKGRRLPDQMHHPDRLQAPLRRTPDGRFEQTTSAGALDEIASKLADIIERYGPRAVASYTGTGGYQCSTAGYQCSTALETARAWHNGIGSPSLYTSVTIDQLAKVTSPGVIGWWDAGFHNFRDAEVSLAIGYNPMVSSYAAVGGLQGTNPFVEMRRAKARGMNLIVVDPRRTEMAGFADIHLQAMPGEDPVLLAGLLRVIIGENLHDRVFCEQWVDGLAALTDAIEPFTPEYVAERCVVDAEFVVAAARMFGAATRGTAGTGTGPNMAPNASLTEHLTIALNVVCGRVNREGDTLESGAFLQPTRTPRAQAIAPQDPRTGTEHRVRGVRGYRGEMLSTALAEEILEPGDGRVRALIVSGGNPAVAFPDQNLTMRALRDLDLLVVIDHRMTATAQEADYVIAPRLSLERADVPHLMDRWFTQPYTNYTEAVVEPTGDVLGEWEVFWGLARHMGTTLRTPGGDLAVVDDPSDDDVIDHVYAKARMSTDEIRANLRTIHHGRSLVVGPADPGCTAKFDLDHPVMIEALLDVANQRTGADLIAGFDPDDYPFRLVSRRMKAVLNSLGPELPGIARKGTTNPAWTHPDDMAELGLTDGDLARISSPTGSVVGVCEPAPDVKRGVVSMAHSWGDGSGEDDKVRDIGVPTSRLTSTTAYNDPITGMVVPSAIPGSVAKVQEE